MRPNRTLTPVLNAYGSLTAIFPAGPYSFGGPSHKGGNSAFTGITTWHFATSGHRGKCVSPMSGMAAITLLATVSLGLVTAIAFGGIAGGLRVIGQQSEPEVLATTDLYYRLNDMDAQVANVLLVGGQHGLGRRTAGEELYQRGPPAGGLGSAARRRGGQSYEALAGEAMYLDGQSSSPVGRLPRLSSSTGRRPTCSRTASCRRRTASPSRTRSSWTGTYQAGRSTAQMHGAWPCSASPWPPSW